MTTEAKQEKKCYGYIATGVINDHFYADNLDDAAEIIKRRFSTFGRDGGGSPTWARVDVCDGETINVEFGKRDSDDLHLEEFTQDSMKITPEDDDE